MLLGLEISRGGAAVLLADGEGAVQHALKQEFPPHAQPATQWIGAMEVCRAVLRRGNITPDAVARMGISFPSLLHDGVVQKEPSQAGWEGYDLVRGALEHLKMGEAVAAPSVVCEGLAEAKVGALREANDWLYIHLGHNLESAFCSQGKVRNGTSQRAGDIGSLVIDRDGALDPLGRRGTLRAYCSGEAFETRCRSYGLTFARAHEVWAMAPSNFAAQSIIEDFVSRLAQGLANAIALLEPPQICLGGSFGVAIFPQIQDSLASKLREMTSPRASTSVTLRAAQLGDDAASLGALALALRGAP